MHHNAAITNWIAGSGEDVFFYTLAKYWVASTAYVPQEWEAEDNLELFLEVRTYTGAPRVRSEYKYVLTPSQYALTMHEIAFNGPEAARLHIERLRPSWATPSRSAT